MDLVFGRVFLITFLIGLIAWIIFKIKSKKKKMGQSGKIARAICLISLMLLFLTMITAITEDNSKSKDIQKVDMQTLSEESAYAAGRLSTQSDVDYVDVTDGDVEIEVSSELAGKMKIDSGVLDILKGFKNMTDDLNGVEIKWYTTHVDNYGNESQGLSATVYVSADTIEKINFKNIQSDNLSKIAERYFVKSK